MAQSSALTETQAPSSSSQPVLLIEKPGRRPGRPKKLVPLRTLGPSWYVLPPEVEQAARKFDDGFVALSGRVERLSSTLQEDPTHALADECHGVAVRELSRHRYFVPELASKAAEAVVAKKRKSKLVKRWRLEESIWALRARRSDSKSFLDSDEVERNRFESDWRDALDHKLLAHIRRTDDKERGAPYCMPLAAGAGGDAPPECHPEVLEVRDVLWEHHDMLYMVFFYYASIEQKPNVFSINYTGYQRLYNDCTLFVPRSVGCQKMHLDALFVAVNSSGKGTNLVEKNNQAGAHALNRQEFLQVLVRIATARYVLTGQVHDVSDAVRLLVEQDVRANVVPEALHDFNTFREHYCYLEEVDKVLRRHETSLRALYTEFSRDKDGKSGKSSSLMGYEEWIGFLQSVYVLDVGKAASTYMCSLKHGTFAFVWSRMAVAGSEDDNAVRMRFENLQFEDFLEALVRISTMVGWPTDEEIEESGYTDAGEFLLNLQQFANVYERFMAKNATSWDVEPRQPIERCVDHLISWVIRVVATAGLKQRLPSVATAPSLARHSLEGPRAHLRLKRLPTSNQ